MGGEANGRSPHPGGLTLEQLVKGAPAVGGMLVGTLLTVIMAATMKGDWILVLVHLWKTFESPKDDVAAATPENLTSSTSISTESFLTRYYMQNVHWYVLLSVAVSFVSFWGLGGYLQWYYYINRRDTPEEWKCQPTRWLPPAEERHEFMLGSTNMFIGSTISGVIASYILNGGYTPLFFHPLEKGLPFLLVSTVGVFIFTDALAYYMHRLFHEPFIYKRIHKWHHRYKSPTAFSAIAMHPLEFLTFQTVVACPILICPMYSGSFIMIILYQYYYGMIDHSGIMMKPLWPWQPHSIFHDDHHKYFHVNFGFNSYFWDWIHDTLRKENRIYAEDIFGGRGKVEKEKVK